MAPGNGSGGSFDEIASKRPRPSKREHETAIFNIGRPIVISPGKISKEKSTSNSSSLIIPETLCHCLQRCTERVTPSLVQRVCVYFKEIPEKSMQYRYLSTLILVRARRDSDDDASATVKGKPIKKLSFKYYIPVLSEDDVKKQILKRKLYGEKRRSKTEKTKDPNRDERPPPDGTAAAEVDGERSGSEDEGEDRDHVEVCLGAFTAIHVISEKRVTITRATCKLRTEIKCSKPFVGDAIPSRRRPRLETANFPDGKIKNPAKKQTAVDVSRLAGEWLARRAAKAREPPYAVDPDTLLPEGLVLPASVTCRPIFPRDSAPAPAPAAAETYRVQDYERDVDIVSDFFSDQLWKPEYTG